MFFLFLYILYGIWNNSVYFCETECVKEDIYVGSNKNLCVAVDVRCTLYNIPCNRKGDLQG